MPALEPVRFEDLSGEYPATIENSSAGAASSERGATVAAEQDVAIAESMIAADTVTVADAAPAAGAGVAGSAGVAGAGRGANGAVRVHGHVLWVREHLQHLSERAHTIGGPATRLAELRTRPWWR